MLLPSREEGRISSFFHLLGLASASLLESNKLLAEEDNGLDGLIRCNSPIFGRINRSWKFVRAKYNPSQVTSALNDLDDKVRKIAEVIIQKPSMQKVIYIDLKSRPKSWRLGTIFCLFLLMRSVWVKGVCSMMMNGQAGCNG
jgi:hypothetical protein